MKVVYVYADSPREWNCSQWNAIIPTKSLNMTGEHSASAIYIDDFRKSTPESEEICQNADIIIVERNYFGDTTTRMQYWKVRGKTVLTIFDDAYDIIHPQNPTFDFWKYGRMPATDDNGKEITVTIDPPPITQFRWGLRIAKGIQVVSEMLAKDWSTEGNTYHVHNFLDMDEYLNVEPLYPHDKEIVIGWCGSMSHRSSFQDSGVIRALQHSVRKYPNLKILISGDKRVYDEIQVANGRKVFQPFVPRDKWTPLLKTLDIGLCPLAGEYDKRRSWIKALEYMAVKVPWIATNYITYKELQPYGIMTENGYTNWENAISEMVENLPKYKEKAETEAFDFSLQQSSYTKIKEVTIPLYQKLIEESYT